MSCLVEFDPVEISITLGWDNAITTDFLSAWKSCFWQFSFIRDIHFKEPSKSPMSGEQLDDLSFLIDIALIHCERVSTLGKSVNEIIH